MDAHQATYGVNTGSTIWGPHTQETLTIECAHRTTRSTILLTLAQSPRPDAHMDTDTRATVPAHTYHTAIGIIPATPLPL